MPFFRAGLLGRSCPIAFLLLFGLLSSNCQVAKAQSTKTGVDSQQDFETLKVRLEAVTEAILDRHVNPATRQQMYLAAAKSLLSQANGVTAQKLAKKFSQANSTEQLQDLLKECWEQKDIAASNSIRSNSIRINLALTAAARASNPRSSYSDLVEEDHVTKQLRENQYVGIGIVIRETDGLVEIIEPLIGGPAHKAGAQAGDLIVSINGKSCHGKNLQEILGELRGALDSSLVVDVENKVTNEKRTLEMVRIVVPIPSISGVSRNQDGTFELGLPLDKEIAYLKFSDFVGSTAAELNELALQIENEGFRGVVFDFRDRNLSVSADLHHVTMLADVISDRGKLATLISDRGETEIRSNSKSLLKEIPIAVLAEANVSGANMLVLAGLANRGNTLFVGAPIYSDLLCYRREVLPKGMGAINNFPFAVCRPELPRVSTTGNSESSGSRPADGPLNPYAPLINPEYSPTRQYQVQNTEGVDPVIRLAVEALKAKMTSDVKAKS